MCDLCFFQVSAVAVKPPFPALSPVLPNLKICQEVPVLCIGTINYVGSLAIVLLVILFCIELRNAHFSEHYM